MIRDLAELARVCHGRLLGDNAGFGRVSSDTRSLEPGSLFVALVGDRFDGNDYVSEAAARGAAAALVSRPADAAIPQVVVDDTLAALTAFAAAWRRASDGTVVALTGSNGKTTVKEMIGSILSRCGPCLITEGNLNNHIGVPLTLCRLEPTHRYAVIEMGANHLEEIAYLAHVARPDVGLVINAGPAHLEGFGSMEGVARGKGELFERLGVTEAAIINADDRFAALWHEMARAAGRVVTFGMQERADFSGADAVTRLTEDGFVTGFELRSPLGNVHLTIALAGQHNVMNALAAAAAAHAAGADLEAIVKGLEATRAVSGRLQMRRTVHGARLIDDSYNANPASLRAGIRSLSEIPGEHWLVLGEMAELGEDSSRLHTEMGLFARENGVQRVFAIGTEAQHAVEAFGSGAQWYDDIDALTSDLQSQLKEGVTVLTKGSRVNRLERIASALTEQSEPGAATVEAD